MASIGNTIIPEAILQSTPVFSLAVPSDSTALSNVRAVLCTGAGTMSLKNAADVTVAVVALAGYVYPLSPSKMLAATTGTYILLY